MKRWSFGLAFVAILVLALTLPAGAPAAPAPHHALPVATAAASNAKPPAAAPHPEIRDAMEALRQARGNLDHAAHNFGGHRLAAMKHIDEAMHELQTCMKYP
ncbi:MAG: hypothetical protein ACRD8A_13855 [Candidatus Acidiferrales bacterium]